MNSLFDWPDIFPNDWADSVWDWRNVTIVFFWVFFLGLWRLHLSYRGDRAMNRDEFAASLDACLLYPPFNNKSKLKNH